MSQPLGFIPLQECEDGWLYRILSRNLSLGVFRKKTRGFIGIRKKWDERFLFEEFHYDTGAPLGTVRPLEKVSKVPADLEQGLDTVFSSGCLTCGKEVDWVGGKWVHLEANPECQELRPVHRQREELARWIDEQAEKLKEEEQHG